MIEIIVTYNFYDSMSYAVQKVLKAVLFCSVTLLANTPYVFAQPSPYDSLSYCLTHFHEKTADKDLQQAIEKVGFLGTGDTMNASRISALLNAESHLISVLVENELMNFNPFNRRLILLFGEKLTGLLEYLPPKKENLYYASSLNNLGVLYNHVGEWQKGHMLIKKAFAIRKKKLGEEHPDYSESLLGMADIYWGKGNKELALSLAQKVLILSKKEGIKFRVIRANCLFFLATVHKQIFNYEMAARFYEKELYERKKIFGVENAHYVAHLYRTADMFQYLWQFDQSILYIEQAIHLTKKIMGENNLLYAYCLNSLGGAYYNLAAYKDAIPLYQQSLAIKEYLFGKDYLDNGISLHNLATAYQKMGDYANALPLAQRAVEISKKAFEKGAQSGFNYAFAINYLASLYQEIGQYREALPLLWNALALTKKTIGEQTHYYARALTTLGILHENIHHYDSALYYYTKVLETRRKILGEAHPEYAATLHQLACLYTKMRKYDLAIHLCRKGLKARKHTFGEKSPAYATSLSSLGELYLLKGKYDTAEILLGQALKIRKQLLGNQHPDYVKSLVNSGLLSMAFAQYANAAFLFAEANNAGLKHLLQTYTSLSEQQKLNLINGQYLPFSYLPSLLYKNPIMPPAILQQLYGNEIMLKGMVLNDQQQMNGLIRQYGDSATLKLFGQWRDNRAFLGQQLLLPLKERITCLDSIRAHTAYQEQQLSRASALFANMRQSEIVTINVIGKKLVAGEAAIEFLMFKLYNKKWTDSTLYAAVVLLPGDSIGRFVPLFEEKQLQPFLKLSARGENWAVNKLYNGMITYGFGAKSPGDSLYTLLWQPLEKYLTNVHTIFYAPAGLLHRFAFNALRCDSTRYLIDKYQLTPLYNTGSLALPRSEISIPSSISLWGNIHYNKKDASPGLVSAKTQNRNAAASFNFYRSLVKDSGSETWRGLPGTREEIDNLKNLFTDSVTRVFMVADSNATEEKFKALDGKSPQVLHIATHGFFLDEKRSINELRRESGGIAFKAQPNSMFRSGLVLAGGNYTWKNISALRQGEDGILTAYEIAQMDLSKTNLVVLSACKTALGDLYGYEGVIGLQRAFKMAGVKQLMMTLWSIPDKETTALMTLFYKNWLSGQSTAEALRSAQLKIKEKHPSPYHWAGFVLVQ